MQQTPCTGNDLGVYNIAVEVTLQLVQHLQMTTGIWEFAVSYIEGLVS